MDRLIKFIKDNKVDIAFLVILSLLALLLTKNLAILNIKGNSMFPTYSDGEVLILKKQKKLSNGDTVVFEPPESWAVPNKNFIKRVVAKDGDTVRYKDSHIIINNEKPIYIDRDFCTIDNVEIKMGEDEYFMLGDNIQNSNDSLTKMCIGNEEFYIGEENLLAFGYKLFSFNGF